MVGLGSLVWWASVSVSGGCCVVLCGGGGGRGAKPRVGGCALGVGSVCFEAWAKILPRWYISGHLKILRIISGNMLYYYQ